METKFYGCAVEAASARLQLNKQLTPKLCARWFKLSELLKFVVIVTEVASAML